MHYCFQITMYRTNPMSRLCSLRDIVVDDLQIAKRTPMPSQLPTASPTRTTVSIIDDITDAPTRSVSYSYLFSIPE